MKKIDYQKILFSCIFSVAGVIWIYLLTVEENLFTRRSLFIGMICFVFFFFIAEKMISVVHKSEINHKLRIDT
jgi:predicted tellurium resistance membrane protein TerC